VTIPADLLLEPGRPERLDAVRALLEAAGLPPDGLEAHLRSFLLASRDGALVATVGVERYGDAALLRSVAVRPDARDAGLGGALVARVLDGLRRDGVREAWLLTTTAAGFFARLGFRPARREDAPPAVRASTQFAGACPATATCMRLGLGPGPGPGTTGGPPARDG
jgi:N-acetylglutamate synthase-like GNAT family acetyltransferase